MEAMEVDMDQAVVVSTQEQVVLVLNLPNQV